VLHTDLVVTHLAIGKKRPTLGRVSPDLSHVVADARGDLLPLNLLQLLSRLGFRWIEALSQSLRLVHKSLEFPSQGSHIDIL